MFVEIQLRVSHRMDIKKITTEAHQKLSEFSDRLKNVDSKFEGVIRFGIDLEKVQKERVIDVSQVTVMNVNYWRAYFEMSLQDPSVYLSHSALHISQGELSRALFLLYLANLVNQIPDYKSLIHNWIEKIHEIGYESNKLIEKGIEKHDQQNFEEAIKYYYEALIIFPNNPWAFYEIGYTMAVKAGLVPDASQEILERTVQISAPYYEKVRQLDPIYAIAYQGERSIANKAIVILEEIKPAYDELIQGNDCQSNFLKMAEGCDKIGISDYALYSFWIYALITGQIDETSADFVKRNLQNLGHSDFAELTNDELFHVCGS